MSTQNNNLPEFFKVYVKHHSSRQMLLPTEFKDHLGRKYGGGAHLNGANGETWAVKLVKQGDELYFKRGWREFVEDNMIEENDFLFFKYHGNLVFSVRVFDEESRCEKVLPLCAECGEGMGSFGRDEERVGLGRRGLSVERSDVGGEVGQLLIPKEEELSMTCTVVNPILITKMTRNNVGKFPMLRFPSSFTQKHFLHYQRDEKMIIRTEESSWILNIIYNKNAYILSGGWTAFVRDNNIEEGDIWIFELVDRLEMKARASSGGI